MALDPHFNKTVLMLHGDDVGDTNFGSMVMGGSGAKTTIEAGTSLIGGTAGVVTVGGRRCFDLSNAGDNTRYAGGYGAQTAVFDGDFTLEWWFYQTADVAYNTYGAAMIGATVSYSACHLYFTSAGLHTITVKSGGLPSFTFSPPKNQWNHHALVVSGGVASYYVNGSRKTFGAVGGTASPTVNGFRFGYVQGLASAGIPGYLSGMRLYKGVAKYSGASFTVPAWPELPYSMLVDASASGRAVSAIGSAIAPYTTDYKFGGACMRFDGAGKLDLPASTDWNFGTGDFTVEAWVKPALIPGGGVTMDMLVFGSFNSTPDFAVSLDNASLVPVLWDGTTAYTGSSGPTVGNWTHVAWCRQNNTLRLFVGGTKVHESACAANFAASTTMAIGYENSSNTRFFNGLIDDLRVTKGVARYTENFTPPTQAFPDGQAGVSGVIRDAEGNLCSRKVFVHSRATGRLLGTAVSDPTTGTYEIAAEEECYVVCLDATDSYNAKIVDGVDPTV